MGAKISRVQALPSNISCYSRKDKQKKTQLLKMLIMTINENVCAVRAEFEAPKVLWIRNG